MERSNEYSLILEARNIQVRAGRALLLDIPSLSVREGEVLSVIGPNGAGKTTLLQTLFSLQKPFQGEIFYRGQPVHADHYAIDYRRKLAMVFQEPLLFDTTVFDNVASGLKIRRMKGREIRDLVEEQLKRLGIAHLSGRSARTLSGGEAQRTSLARAFAISPEILFLDEPFASLDPPSRDTLIEDLGRILRQTRTTTLMATHDRLDALRLSDRIAIMKEGQIVQIGSPGAVTRRPANEFVASFVGAETILTGRVIKTTGGTFVVSVEGKGIEVAGEAGYGETIVFCIRPENVIVSTRSSSHSSDETTSVRNIFPGRIERIVPLGFFQKIDLDCGFPLVAYITNPSLESLLLQAGKEVLASFKATAIHVIRRKKEED